jgi:hypothetical protein
MAWRQRKSDIPRPATLNRLVTDETLGVRLTLLGLLRDGDRAPELRTAIADNDSDSYVRAMARAPIRDTRSSAR